MVFQYYNSPDSITERCHLNVWSVFRHNDKEVVSCSKSTQDTLARVKTEKEFLILKHWAQPSELVTEKKQTNNKLIFTLSFGYLI